MPDANALFRAISRDDYSPSPLLAKVVLNAAIDGDEVASQIAATTGTGWRSPHTAWRPGWG